MTVSLAHAAATDIGLQRTTNEDAYLAQPPLFAVADGLGGHLGGEIAARLAIEILSGWAGDGHEALASAVKEANRSIHERAGSDPELHGMGTTITALLAADSSIQIVHVGDSRAYLFRDGELRRLTRDHTLAERLVREGKISPGEADRHPQRSILERAVGVGPEVEIDVHAIDVLPGDRLLLCTDGLTSMLLDEEIRTVLAEEPDPNGAARRLVDEAVKAGGRDNVTTLIVDYPEKAGTSSDPGGKAEAAAAGSTLAPEPTRSPTAVGEPGRPGGPPGAPGQAGASPGAPGHLGGASGVGAPSVAKPATPGTAHPGPRAVPEERAEIPRDKRRMPSGPGMMLGVVVGMLVLLVAGGGLLSRWILSNSWYVGEREGMVAVYRGLPGSFGGLELSSLERRTEVPVDALPDYYRRQLEEGIPAQDRAEAEEIVRNIGERRRPSDSPAPPGPEASPTGSPPASP